MHNRKSQYSRIFSSIPSKSSFVIQLKADFKGAQSSLRQRITDAAPLRNGSESTSMQSVTRIFSELRKMIDECEKNLKTQIRTIEETNTVLIDSYLAELNSKQATLSKNNEEFERILSTKDALKLLEAKDRLTDCLKKLTAESKELKQPIKTKYQIDGVNQLQVDVKNVLQKARVIELKSGNRFGFELFNKN